jgi:hypothetical protein
MLYFKEKTGVFDKENYYSLWIFQRPMSYLVILLNLSFHFAFAQKENDKPQISGFLDFKEYYETRDHSTFTLNVMANFSARFQNYSLTNYSIGTKSADLNGYHAEQHFRWNTHKMLALDLSKLWTNQSGPSIDNVRYDIRWRINQTPRIDSVLNKINLISFVNFQLVKFAEHSIPKAFTQIEYVYKIDILPSKLNKRLYISGFADKDLQWSTNNSLKPAWATEYQLDVRITGRLHTVTEYRLNEYLPEKTG